MTEEEDRIKKGGGLPGLKILSVEEQSRAKRLMNAGYRSDTIAHRIMEERNSPLWNLVHSEVCDLMSEVVENDR